MGIDFLLAGDLAEQRWRAAAGRRARFDGRGGEARSAWRRPSSARHSAQVLDVWAMVAASSAGEELHGEEGEVFGRGMARCRWVGQCDCVIGAHGWKAFLSVSRRCGCGS